MITEIGKKLKQNGPKKHTVLFFSGDDKENYNKFSVDLFKVNNFETKNQINSDLNLTQQNTNPNFEVGHLRDRRDNVFKRSMLFLR